jgi:hypothetical protein
MYDSAVHLRRCRQPDGFTYDTVGNLLGRNLPVAILNGGGLVSGLR